jgi:hypothetical protein
MTFRNFADFTFVKLSVLDIEVVGSSLSFSVILSQGVGWAVGAKNPHEEQRVRRRGNPFV